MTGSSETLIGRSFQPRTDGALFINAPLTVISETRTAIIAEYRNGQAKGARVITPRELFAELYREVASCPYSR